MNDTRPQITAKMIEMFQKMTPQERLTIGCSMFDFSKQLVINGIRKEYPDITPSMLRKELFLIFYRNDFDLNQQRKIIDYLFQWKD